MRNSSPTHDNEDVSHNAFQMSGDPIVDQRWRKARKNRDLLLRIPLVRPALALIGWFASLFPKSRTVSVIDKQLHLPRWNAPPFRFVFMADLHAVSPVASARARLAIELAIAQNPQAILFGGDFVTFASEDHMTSLHHALEPMKECSIPSFAVLGNHDSCDDPDEIVRVLQSYGINVLLNSAATVNGITILGLDDGLFERAKPELLPEVSHNSILLMHEPDYVELAPKSVSLQLSGHTHGGQICLPGGFPLYHVAGGKNFNAGFYPNARVPLFVTRGIGNTVPDVRIFSWPEILVITASGE